MSKSKGDSWGRRLEETTCEIRKVKDKRRLARRLERTRQSHVNNSIVQNAIGELSLSPSLSLCTRYFSGSSPLWICTYRALCLSLSFLLSLSLPLSLLSVVCVCQFMCACKKKEKKGKKTSCVDSGGQSWKEVKDEKQGKGEKRIV